MSARAHVCRTVYACTRSCSCSHTRSRRLARAHSCVERIMDTSAETEPRKVECSRKSFPHSVYFEPLANPNKNKYLY
eukprot:4158412-Pleurochrysis_carterae.AAC.3